MEPFRLQNGQLEASPRVRFDRNVRTVFGDVSTFFCNTTKTPDFANECLFDFYAGFLPAAVLIPMSIRALLHYSRDRENGNQNPGTQIPEGQKYLSYCGLGLLLAGFTSLIANT